MDDEKIAGRGIRVDYYEGAYGPTIRIDAQTLDDLNKIKSMFVELAQTRRSVINFLDVVGVHTTGLDQFTLERVETTDEFGKSLKHQRSELAGVGFVWSLPANGWKRCAGLIDGLIEYNRPSHQYLTKEGVDDVIVELAFKESN